MTTDHRQAVRDFIRQQAPDAQLDDDDDIFAMGVVSSLFALQLVLWVERTFGVPVKGDDLDISNFSSIGAVARFIEARRGSLPVA